MTIEIRDDRIYGLRFGEFFNVQLHNGDNPAIELKVNFDSIPIKTLAKLAFDTMKVKFRPHVKAMDTEAFTKAFNHETITWREMITKAGAHNRVEIADETDDEIQNRIDELTALLNKPKPIEED